MNTGAGGKSRLPTPKYPKIPGVLFIKPDFLSISDGLPD
jgi:hypothetical protein